MHPAFLRQMVALAGITGTASSDDVGPVVIAAPGERDEMVSGEAFPVAQVALSAVAILAAVAISSEQECIGDLAAETARDMDELDEANDGGSGERESFTADDIDAAARKP